MDAKCYIKRISLMSLNQWTNDVHQGHRNQQKPPKWHFEDDFPFPKVGYVSSLEGTPPKFNIQPEKRWLDDSFPIGKVAFQINRCWIWYTRHRVTITTTTVTFLAGNPYKPSFKSVTEWGIYANYLYISKSHLLRSVLSLKKSNKFLDKKGKGTWTWKILPVAMQIQVKKTSVYWNPFPN